MVWYWSSKENCILLLVSTTKQGQAVWYEGDGGYLLPGKVIRADAHGKTLVVQDVGNSEV